MSVASLCKRRCQAPSRFRFPGFILLCLCATALCGCQLLGLPGESGKEPEVVQNPCIVLALPTSGQYNNISAKIRRGAEIARKQLKSAGRDIRLENINTDAPNWLAQLQALPPICAVVGGPLRDKSYVEARKAGLTEQRAFFGFMPTLQKGDEGKAAWRFFPSPQDQINTVIRFASDDLNIRTYGALFPTDNYGRRMTHFLEQDLGKRHMSLQKASYGAATPAAMTAALKPLLQPRQSEDGKYVIPQTTFEAIFLPDSWKRVDMITSSLMANGEDRLVLLGTTLWEQGLSGKQIPVGERYALAVYPGAWDKNRAPAALKGAGNDFWSALGYDFVNFGAALALGIRPPSAAVTARAQKAAGQIRAMAPIYWDANGNAHQQLYLFQPSPSGPAALDLNSFRQKRAAIAEKAALRMQGWNNIDPVTGEAITEKDQSETRRPEDERPEDEPPASSAASDPTEPENEAENSQASGAVSGASHTNYNAPATPRPAAAPAPKAAEEGAMSAVPRPSYKLSLPASPQN